VRHIVVFQGPADSSSQKCLNQLLFIDISKEIIQKIIEMEDHQQSGLMWVHPAAVLTDTVLSLCLVAPMVVGYWRGTWFLLDAYLYPDDAAASCWISLLLGFGSLLLATWFQRQLQDYVTRQTPCIYFLLSRLYTVVLCFGTLYDY
jgi:hypothetical protein